MPKTVQGPELKKYLDKQVQLKLNAGREVVGILRGFDAFMNVTLDGAEEIAAGDERIPIGAAVCV